MSRLNVMECRALSLLSSELLVDAKKYPTKMLVLYTAPPPPLLQKKKQGENNPVYMSVRFLCVITITELLSQILLFCTQRHWINAPRDCRLYFNSQQTPSCQ